MMVLFSLLNEKENIAGFVEIEWIWQLVFVTEAVPARP
jgi:hypothetical protein